MLAIIVPAHNEEDHIQACVAALLRSAEHPLLCGEAVSITVVADDCRDRTARLASRMGVKLIKVDGKNVGSARHAGAAAAIASGARWLAFTDADTVVEPGWLAAQLALGADAVCGTVSVADWRSYGESVRRYYDLIYNDADGHRHIHGANLGVSVAAYLAAGGFSSLATGEDVALVTALKKAGAHIAWSSRPRVTTSARRNFKAPGGFGATLQKMEQLRQWSRNAAGALA